MSENRISFGSFDHPNSELQEFVEGMFDEMLGSQSELDSLSRLTLGEHIPPPNSLPQDRQQDTEIAAIAMTDDSHDDSQYSHDLRLAIEGCVAFDRECGALQSSSSEEMLRQLHDQLIAAACIQPQFMQSARESLRSQHDLHRLTLVLMGATILDIGEAFALASELRDRYRNAMTVQHLIDAVNAGRLRRVSRGYVVLPIPNLRYYSGGDATESTQGEVIGDRACKYNAQSSHLRCAINPCGPCEGCDYFESEERDRDE